MSIDKSAFCGNYFGPYNSCGWKTDVASETGLYLTPGTTLREKYLALDLNLYGRLAVKEYLPRDIATRSSSTTTVTLYTGPSREHFEYGLKNFLQEACALAWFEDLPGIVSVKDFFPANETGDRP
nr:hypothetical protein [uncultured Desulfobacter sp.]